MRSIEKYRFRYVSVLSDGDSSMFRNLLGMQIYGNLIIKKEECVNHIHKRMTSALRKLLKTGRTVGVTFGGRGAGKLNSKTIVKLGEYFSKAVCINIYF